MYVCMYIYIHIQRERDREIPSCLHGKDCLQCRRPGFNPWVRKIPSRRGWLTTPLFLPGEFHGQKSWWATVHRVTKIKHNLAINISIFFHLSIQL